MRLILRDDNDNDVPIEHADIHPSIKRVLAEPICNLEQCSEAWLDARKLFPVTGSACGIITGEDRSKSIEQLFREKTGRGNQGNSKSFNCTQGHLNEPLAQSLFIERTGKIVFNTGLVPHPVYDFIAMSPDGLTLDGELLEIKCPVSREIGDFVPTMYNAQLQLGMEVFGMEYANFVQYRPETEYRHVEYSHVRVARDRNWFSRHLPAFRDFSDRVRAFNNLPLSEKRITEGPTSSRKRESKTRLGAMASVGVSLSKSKIASYEESEEPATKRVNIGRCLLK
jgi:putative phage-type endonuclease